MGLVDILRLVSRAVSFLMGRFSDTWSRQRETYQALRLVGAKQDNKNTGCKHRGKSGGIFRSLGRIILRNHPAVRGGLSNCRACQIS